MPLSLVHEVQHNFLKQNFMEEQMFFRFLTITVSLMWRTFIVYSCINMYAVVFYGVS